MEPAPFENVKYQDSTSKIRLESTQKPERTRVLNPKGKVLWSVPIFTGRHELHLSPAGHFLILYGNIYFTWQIQLSRDEQLAAVYEQGKLLKKIVFADVFSEDPQKLSESLQLLEKGGGWVPLKGFIEKMDIQWSSRKITLTLYNRKTKAFEF